MSFFQNMEELPPDPIFGLSAEFKKDPRRNKYTLITGYFRDENLITPVLDTVSEVERGLAKNKPCREYLPISGDQGLVAEIGKLVFGPQYENAPISGFQTVGGTGALYLTGKLCKHFTNTIAISNPTWANHWGIFALAGLKAASYRYYKNRALDFEGCVEDIKKLPEKASVLLHTNCHNPTGLDFTNKQWETLSELIKEKNLFPILDMAYQGFSDSPEKDAFAPKLFLKNEHEFALTYTCAKNFSLYSERVGALFVVGKENKEAIQSQIRKQMRGSYSNPPFHGAMVVKTILANEELKKKWLIELETMRYRMNKVRSEFVERMIAKNPGGNWDLAKRGKGLFCYSELKENAVKKLKEKGFYVASDGRINLTGLNDKNMEQFVDALFEVTH